MPELADDDLDNIKEGTYVYWMDQDDDIPRGSLGEVIEVDGEKRRVRFPECKYSVAASKLNVSDFQKGSYVHFTNDDISDDIGQVKDLDDGKLVIGVEGKEVKEKPKYLIKCDIQPGMFVFWKLQDKETPAHHVGQVLEDLDDRGKVKVKFPNGSWRFKPKDLIRAQVQPHSYVQWNDHDDDVAMGELGEVTGEVNDDGKVKVAFSKGTWSFRHDSLVCYEKQLGSFVRWQKIDEDVKKGDIGQVVGIKVSEGRLRVQFPKGRWKFRANELSLCKIQPGNLVTWSRSDEDIPRGDLGEVIRLDERRISIQWPKGHWSMRMKEVNKLRFQKGDRVQWTDSDDDIPEGHIGIVMGVKYSEDTGQKLYVNWPKGRWSMQPSSLKILNFDSDGANQLKMAFKRFDEDGDGTLSEEELINVLGGLGGQGGGLAPQECKQLFKALDRNQDGKLTIAEFIDYVFSGASATGKVVLADGFGLDASLGFAEEEEDRDGFEYDDREAKGQPFDGPVEMKSSFDPESAESIDADTQVSRAEWATAMLTVGVPRAAALACFDALLEEVGEEGLLKLEDLASELNGMGGSAGVEELRDPVGKVKCGHVDVVDLDVPSEELGFERDLARKTGIDALIFDTLYNGKRLEDVAQHFPKARLSALERKVLSEMNEDELVEAVAKGSDFPETLSAVASWQSCRESCQREVQEIIDRCKSEGTRYTDESFNPLENEAAVLYVDKKKPGWDCTVGEPSGWKRLPEIVGSRMVVCKEGAVANDVEQGSIGDCFAVAALAAMAGKRKSFLRQALVAYDIEVGVYGVMFCEEMHFTYEIIDDIMALNKYGRLKYAESASSSREVWVPVLEKAYFKHMTCLEMCDGGHAPETIFSFLGGVWGSFHIGHREYSDPSRFWKKINRGLENGYIMTNGFEPPSKGKYANLGGGEEGQCGEAGMCLGLHDGHAYSTLRTGEVDGYQLICMRNPWSSGEWEGPWADHSDEWTTERTEKVGRGKETTKDGTFWMDVADFVQLSDEIRFSRPFGPTWQSCAQYGCFGKVPPFKAIAKKSYQACEDDEISFKRGDIIECTKNSGSSWLKGVHEATGNKGYFRRKDVDMRCEDTFKYQLTLTNVSEDARIILGLFLENQKKRREYYTRRQDGMHYKDDDYPDAYLMIFDSSGNMIDKLHLGSSRRSAWQYLKPAKGPFRAYVSCKATDHRRFALYAFAPHGELRWEKQPCDRSMFFSEVGGPASAAREIREFIYDQTQDLVSEYMELGSSLLADYPGVGGKVMAVASTVGGLLDADGVRDVAEDCADRVRTFVNSEQVQSVTNQVKDVVGGERAQELRDKMGNLMDRASSWWG